MKKKALIFSWSMVLITLIVLTYAYIVISYKIKSLPDYSLGEQQMSLIETYQAAHDRLFIFDSAAATSAKLAIYDLAYNGGRARQQSVQDYKGFYGSEDCGSYRGYTLWNSKDKSLDQCFPNYFFEYQSAFNDHMGMRLSLNSLPLSMPYAVSISERSDYSVITGITSGTLTFSKAVRASPQVYDSTGSSIPSGILTTYDACGALYYYKGKEDGGQACAYTTPEDFKDFVSLNSPYIRFLDNEEGNALQPDFAAAILAVAQKWNAEEGGKAALGLYSASTGRHSCMSKHNLGLALDITGCFDKAGNYHDSKARSEIFIRCKNLVREEWKGKGLMISYEDCILSTGDTCASKETLIASHYNHMHIQEG